MAIWDQQDGGMDPTQMLLLASMAQGLGRSASRSTNPVWGAPQQGDGMDQLLPALLQMQQLRAGIANQQADNELQRQQFGLAQQKFAEEQRQSDQRAQMIQQAAKDMGVPVSVAMANPDAVTSAWADRLKAQALTPGQRLYAGGQLQAENPALLEAQDSGVFNPRTGSWALNPEMLKAALAKATAGATNVSVSPTSIYNATEGAFNTKVYEAAAEEYNKINADAEAARKMSNDFKQINSLLQDVPTGQGFDQWRLKFAKMMGGMGMPVDAGQIASKEAAESLVNQFALAARSPGGPLGGLPGSASDKDIEFLRAIPPGIEQTPQGRKLMSDMQEARAEHLTKRASAVNKYVQDKGGKVDPIELQQFKAAYDAQNSAYGDVANKWMPKLEKTAAPAAGSVVDEARKYLER